MQTVPNEKENMKKITNMSKILNQKKKKKNHKKMHKKQKMFKQGWKVLSSKRKDPYFI